MKKNEKIMIVALVIITIIVIIIAIVRGSNNKKEETQNTQTGEQAVINQEEFVSVLEDGTKVNTSQKLKETKKIEGMEISDLQITQKDDVTVLLGTITNTSETTQGGYTVEMKILDKQGKEITTVSAYIGTLQPGKTTQLNTSKTFDYANAYDLSIAKK